jgi:hypothetical protein
LRGDAAVAVVAAQKLAGVAVAVGGHLTSGLA